jgi:ABC-type polysaccharide/polyol phosphate export permease
VSSPSAPPPRAKILSRAALGAVRTLTPLLGNARAQWLVARTWAVLYLVRFYLATQNARASLGWLWVGIAPLLLIAVYLPVFLFVFKARLPTPGHDSPLDYALFCLVGLVVWSSVQDAFMQGASSLVHNATIVRHSPTPPAMLPFVKVLTSFVWLSIGLTILVAILAVTGRNPGARLLILIPAYVLLFAFMIGLSLTCAYLTAYVRDLLQIFPTLIAIEFFAAPITYSPNMNLGRLSAVIQANPLTPFLGMFRASVLTWEPFAWHDLGLAAAWAAGAILVALVLTHRLEGGLKDTLV